MSSKAGPRPDEGLMMMQELDDRLKEQIDKLEHVRLAAVELKDNLSGVGSVGAPQDIPHCRNLIPCRSLVFLCALMLFNHRAMVS